MRSICGGPPMASEAPLLKNTTLYNNQYNHFLKRVACLSLISLKSSLYWLLYRLEFYTIKGTLSSPCAWPSWAQPLVDGLPWLLCSGASPRRICEVELQCSVSLCCRGRHSHDGPGPQQSSNAATHWKVPSQMASFKGMAPHKVGRCGIMGLRF